MSQTTTKPIRVYPTTHKAIRRLANARRQTIAVTVDEMVKSFSAQHQLAEQPATAAGVKGAA